LHHFRARHDAAILPAGDLRRFMALPAAVALAIDDADGVADGEALLHLLNSAAEHHKPLLLAAREPPSRWRFSLPDLVSRLRATPTVGLLPPDDSLLAAMLTRLLAERQLAVQERLPRTGNAMREAAARLDRLSLAAGRAVTAKHAQQVVDECLELDPPTEKGPEQNPGPP
jgi:chromosomal replication initiation ATPase DnaA